MSSILIAEDEKNIADVVKDILEAEGHAVRVVRNGVAAIAAYHESRPDLLILDVMMPKKGGFEVCAEIREVDELTPILFLTARDADVDKVHGLNIGADDYLTKPFSAQELVARVAAILRRAARSAEVKEPIASDASFVIAGHKVDPRRLTLTNLVTKRTTSLSMHDLMVLRVFAENPDIVLSRDELIDKAWGMRMGATTRTVDMAILKMRKLLGSESSHIETIRAGGYRYRP